jgi:DNA-binding NarL/FixJ family response regulator
MGRLDLRLTPRELEVLQAMANGHTNETGAEALGITWSTFRTHVSNILRKLGVSKRIPAVVIGIKRGWIA